MALSRELLKRLNTAEEPLPKRLKLAENAFCKLDLPITRKEDLIVQWMCNICLMNESAWPSLRFCLKSDQFNVKQDIKDSILSVLVQKLNQHADHLNADVIECCTTLLLNSSMQQYFVNKPEDLGLLTQSMLNCIHRIMKSVFDFKSHLLNEGLNTNILTSNDNCFPLIAYNNVIIATECIVQIYKSSTNSKQELKSIFLQDILYPLCAIIDHRCTDSSNRLGIAAHNCVQNIVFDKYKYHKGHTEDTDKMPFAKVFTVLADGTINRTLKSNLTTFLLVFRAAISTYNMESGMLDFIFRNLIRSAGQYKIMILSVLIPHLGEISLDFSNRINNETLSDFLQNIIEDILSTEDLTSPDCNVLTEISNLNPLLIQNKIHDILKLLFLQKRTFGQTHLLIAILDATVKLRKSEKLISMLLMALKEILQVDRYYGIEQQTYFPSLFSEKFTKSLGNITNAQQVVMMRALTYHLNTDCLEILESNAPGQSTVMLTATTELLIAFFNGIHAFEYSGALEQQKKFVNVFKELGNTLALLMDKALRHTQDVIVILLSGILSWTEVYNMLKYYAPNTLKNEVKFPIMEKSWQQLVQRIKDFNEDNYNIMVILILHKLRETLSDKTSVKLKDLIGSIKHSWSTILKSNAEIISYLNDQEVSTVTYFLLRDMMSNTTNLVQWADIIKNESLQENKKFSICLLNHVLVEIGLSMPKGMTHSITQYINENVLLEAENTKNENAEVIFAIKKELLQDKWAVIQGSFTHKIEVLLNILLYLPLIDVSIRTRTLTFLVIYSLKRECSDNGDIVSLCNKVVSDVLERPNVQIFQYIDATLYINQLPQTKTALKAFEHVLRNIHSYDALRIFIKSCKHNAESIHMLLERCENIRSKLNSNQKIIFKKAEKRLSKMLLNALPADIKRPVEVKYLTSVLKMAIAFNTIDETLLVLTDSVLRQIFKSEAGLVLHDRDNFVQEGLKLVLIVLQNQKTLKSIDIPVTEIWEQILKCPCQILLLPLLASRKPKELQELLERLQCQTIKSLLDTNEQSLVNNIAIWSAVMKVDMSPKRNKLRIAIIDSILRNVQDLQMSDNSWPYFLKLLQNILSAKHLYIPGNVIDMSICISLKSLDVAKICVCSDVLVLCGILIKTRLSLITDRLPILLLLYRRVVSLVIRSSKNISSKEEEHNFKCLALDIEKLTNALTKLKKDIVRLSPYLLADFLQLFSENSVPIFAKISLENCVSQLIGICDQHGISLLSRTLSASMKEVFKIQLSTFNKFYKFSGKI